MISAPYFENETKKAKKVGPFFNSFGGFQSCNGLIGPWYQHFVFFLNFYFILLAQHHNNSSSLFTLVLFYHFPHFSIFTLCHFVLSPVWHHLAFKHFHS